jgi:hypothetical protein
MNNSFNPSLYFTFIGAALLGYGIFAYFRQRAWIARSIPADGVVVELVRSSVTGEYVRSRTESGIKTENKYSYRPLIRFKTHTGRTINFIPGAAMRPPPYNVGECVEVLYDPDDPQQAQINRFTYLWFNVLVLVFFGMFMIGMGLIGIVLAG